MAGIGEEEPIFDTHDIEELATFASSLPSRLKIFRHKTPPSPRSLLNERVARLQEFADFLRQEITAVEKMTKRMKEDLQEAEDMIIYEKKKAAHEFKDGWWVLIRKGEVIIHTEKEEDARDRHAKLNDFALLIQVGHEQDAVEFSEIVCELDGRAYFVSSDVTNIVTSKKAEVKFKVDTGATDVLLTRDIVTQLGLERAGKRKASAAMGESKLVDFYYASLQLGDKSHENVTCYIGNRALLGMSVLKEYRLEMNNFTKMTLTPLNV